MSGGVGGVVWAVINGGRESEREQRRVPTTTLQRAVRLWCGLRQAFEHGPHLR